MNNITIANETIKITADGFYEKDGKRVELPKNDFTAVVAYSPEKGAELLKNMVIPDGKMCEITVTTGEVPVDPYSIDLTYALGTNAYDDGVATVNGVADVKTLKFGTSSKNGSAVITIPAGATEVSFYAVGWKAKESMMTVKNGETTLKEISVVANEGATGNAPYTITVADTDKYVVSFESALAAETALTFESTGRVILFAIVAK